LDVIDALMERKSYEVAHTVVPRALEYMEQQFRMTRYDYFEWDGERYSEEKCAFFKREFVIHTHLGIDDAGLRKNLITMRKLYGYSGKRQKMFTTMRLIQARCIDHHELNYFANKLDDVGLVDESRKVRFENALLCIRKNFLLSSEDCFKRIDRDKLTPDEKTTVRLLEYIVTLAKRGL
jgi:hypothetical protein